MITVRTEYPVIHDSLDQLYPEGIYYDNNINPAYVSELENYYNGERISILDLGCAGGEFVCEMFRRGYNAVGIDGSDHILNVRSEMVEKIGIVPCGLPNWQEYGNIRLFTCDVTKEYDILENGIPMQFDLITAWDVLEHFEPDSVDIFVNQLYKHMKPSGLFLASIAQTPATARLAISGHTQHFPVDIDYHKSVFPFAWWNEKLGKRLTHIEYPFTSCNRSIIDVVHQTGQYVMYAGKKL